MGTLGKNAPKIPAHQSRSVARSMDLASKSVTHLKSETKEEKKEQQRITSLYDTQMRSADQFEYGGKSYAKSTKLSAGAEGFRQIGRAHV